LSRAIIAARNGLLRPKDRRPNMQLLEEIVEAESQKDALTTVVEIMDITRLPQ